VSVVDAVVYALLALGVGIELISVLGVVLLKGVYDRLHYVAPSVLGALLIVAAIWVREGPSTIALEGTLLVAFLMLASPALAHGTGRAARISEHGDWRPQRAEGIEVERP
jgi:monovalent cation/proton antiporter MnhG/PhaG subunit